jgi:hypothetical protein
MQKQTIFIFDINNIISCMEQSQIARAGATSDHESSWKKEKEISHTEDS